MDQSAYSGLLQAFVVNLRPAMTEQDTMLQACKASEALQKSFNDAYRSVIKFYFDCIQASLISSLGLGSDYASKGAV